MVAALALVALQFHRWSKLSSGSVFSPEFPRPVVVLFNWAFGAIVLLALMQLVLDVGLLFGMLIHGGSVSAPDGVRYGLAALAAVAAAIGVHQAMRIPPLKDIEVGIQGLPRQFDGYTILQLTDLHISRHLRVVANFVGRRPRLFPADNPVKHAIAGPRFPATRHLSSVHVVL